MRAQSPKVIALDIGTGHVLINFDIYTSYWYIMYSASIL